MKTSELKIWSPILHEGYQAIHLSEKIATHIPALDSGYSYFNSIGELDGSQSVVPEPLSSVSYGNLLEMKIGVLSQASWI